MSASIKNSSLTWAQVFFFFCLAMVVMASFCAAIRAQESFHKRIVDFNNEMICELQAKNAYYAGTLNYNQYVITVDNCNITAIKND